jgi:ATP-dependent protease Clp ATPase subunit
MVRETGVRSLRSMFEQLLLDVRFEIGARKGERIVVTADFVHERLSAEPQPAARRKRETA